MVKIADIIIPLYKKFTPVCESKKISLNLDLVDPTLRLDENAEDITKKLKTHLASALARTDRSGAITIGAKPDQKHIAIYIKDTGAALTKTERAALTDDLTEVHSRHGYGTTITFKFRNPA